MSAFVLVIDKHSSSRPGAGLRLPGSPGVVELGFEASCEADWTDRSGAVRMRCWSERPGAWEERDGNLTFVAGDLRRGQLVDGAPPDQPAPTVSLRQGWKGVFASVVLTAAGDGLARTDPIGHRCLYAAEDDRSIVVSSRASLAARTLAGTRTPPRDGFGMCWLAFTTYRVGERSGFEGVRVLRPGTALRLTKGRAAWERIDPFVVAPDDEMRALSVAQLAEVLLDDLADSLGSLLAGPERRRVLSLTGGKDSRVVLAAALRADLAQDLVYETVGPPELADVQIATELTEMFGLRHDVRFLDMQVVEPFGDRFRRFVHLTGGMVSGWDLQASAPTDDLRLTGICGELLRSCQKLPGSARAPGGLWDAIGPARLGRLGLVRPEVAAMLGAELRDHLDREPSPEADPLDRAQAHFAGSRMRFTRLGAREELSGGRVHPLYSPLALRAALSLDSSVRQSEVLVACMLQQASAPLLHHRFTDAGWDATARTSLGLPEGHAPASTAPRKAEPLMASLFAARVDERSALLSEVFADAGNPIWDWLHRPAALNAIERYAELRTPERQELFGAATGAVWMSG
ncbi:MAG: hypothetical protein ABIX10_01820 [Acidimicrobiales bacterium]